MDKLNNALILQISKYLDINNINNFLKVNKYIHNIKLYKLFYGIIFKNRFGIDCIKSVNYYKNNFNYNLGDYLKDLLFCFNIDIAANKSIFSKRYINGYSSESNTLISLSLNQTKIYWKYQIKKKHKIHKIRICNIYRIPILKKRFYKKNFGLNLLAIIY